jgi:Tol biopolymer transport system component
MTARRVVRDVLARVAIGVAAAALAACATAQPSTLPTAAPSPSGSVSSRGPESPGASGVANGFASVDLPVGSIVFDRYATAFGADGEYLGTAIFRTDDGSERPLTVPVSTPLLEPAWSRDATQLLVNIYHLPAGPGRPALVKPDGSGFTMLEPTGLDDDLGCNDWSPDGQTLVCFINGRDPRNDGIYSLRLDGLRLHRLTTSPFHIVNAAGGSCGGGEGHPRYSPDGSKIAFIRQRCGVGANPSADESSAIELMNADGTALRELVEQGRVRSHPGTQISWRPDGNAIAFGSQDGDLFEVDVDSRAVTAIPLPASIGQHHASGPEWSPDGSRLAFSLFVVAQGSSDLYAMAPDGSDLVRLTTSEGTESLARWGRPEIP